MKTNLIFTAILTVNLICSTCFGQINKDLSYSELEEQAISF